MIGKEHPSTAISYSGLAGVYWKLKEYIIALNYYLYSYKVYVNKHGKEHPHTQIIYKNMKMAYFGWNPDGNFEQWLEEQMKEQ